jgi:two-component system, cell cycle sensor histidine kinase and response regulator CckA
MNARIRTKVSKAAFRTACIYALAGAAWILVSGHVGDALVSDPLLRDQVEIYKGWLFVLVTAGLLHWILRAQLIRWEAEVIARRKAIDALHLSEERFQLALRGSNDGVWDWNLEDDSLYLSPRYKEMVGYQPDELANHLDTWRQLVHPEDLARTMSRFDEFVAGKGELLEVEFRLRHKDGHWIHILSRAFAIRRDHRIVRLVGTHVDLTERKNAEEALQQKEAMYRTAVNGVREVVFQSDPGGRWTFLNTAWEHLTGFAIAESLGKYYLEFVHPDDREENERLFRSLVQREREFCDHTARYVRRDGGFRWVEVHGQLVTDENGTTLGIVGTLQDVTERRKSEEELRKSEERYRAIVETTFDWIWEVDAEIRFTFSSPKIYDLLGYRPEEIIGKHYSDLMTPEALERVKAEGARLTTPERTFCMLEAECLHRDGRRVIIESSGVPKHGPNGEPIGYRGSSRNITERKLAEKERQALESQLRQAQKMEAIGTLAGGVAHDFNNLLTVIHGNASLLLSPQLGKVDRDDCAHQIVRAAERAASLTRQLLMFSRKQVMQLSNVNLNAVVANMTKMLQRILGEDVTLQTTYAPNVCLTRGDVGMIEQILMNLAVNARDAMPHGGQLNIATGIEELSARDAQQQPDANPGLHVWLSVTDTGSGISPEILPHIFEPFFTTKDIGKGTGLGLATIYGIVRQHRGWIKIDTDVGKGTAFKIYFPAFTGNATTTAMTPPSRDLPTGHETILVVEDDPAVRDLMIQLLEHCGYRILHAPSGRAALDVWAKSRNEVQLLLTDLVMPDGMTGLQLAERVRKEAPMLPVMYVTGYSPELAAKGTSLVEGVNLLQKPFSPDKLARAVRSLLNKQN